MYETLQRRYYSDSGARKMRAPGVETKSVHEEMRGQCKLDPGPVACFGRVRMGGVRVSLMAESACYTAASGQAKTARVFRLFIMRRGAGVAEQGCLLSSFTPKG